MRKTIPGVAAVALFLLSADTYASVRLTYLIQNKPTPIAWNADSFPLRYTLSEQSLQLVGERANVDRSFAAWEQTTDSRVKFAAGEVEKLTAGRDGKNVVSLSDRLFADSGFVAFTTHWYDNEGRITESDIQIDPSAAKGVNLQTLLQHEIGHLLGLDHSANLSSTMYPFVSSSASAIALDDRLGMAAMYPADGFPQSGGTIRGEVRSGSGGLFAAQVVLVDGVGAPVATALTDRDGRFEFVGAPRGTFRIYAEPLDGPVEGRNLSGIYRDAVTGFRTIDTGRTITVAPGGTYEGITLMSDGLPASLNPRWIGVFPAGTRDVSLSSNVSRLKVGETVSVAVGGDGIMPGFSTFEIPNPAVQRVSDFNYGSNFVWATFKVSPAAQESPVVVRVSTGSENATLTGALRIEGKGGPARKRPVG